MSEMLKHKRANGAGGKLQLYTEMLKKIYHTRFSIVRRRMEERQEIL